MRRSLARASARHARLCIGLAAAWAATQPAAAAGETPRWAELPTARTLHLFERQRAGTRAIRILTARAPGPVLEGELGLVLSGSSDGGNVATTPVAIDLSLPATDGAWAFGLRSSGRVHANGTDAVSGTAGLTLSVSRLFATPAGAEVGVALDAFGRGSRQLGEPEQAHGLRLGAAVPLGTELHWFHAEAGAQWLKPGDNAARSTRLEFIVAGVTLTLLRNHATRLELAWERSGELLRSASLDHDVPLIANALGPLFLALSVERVWVEGVTTSVTSIALRQQF